MKNNKWCWETIINKTITIIACANKKIINYFILVITFGRAAIIWLKENVYNFIKMTGHRQSIIN